MPDRPYIILVGSISDGYIAYGPFDGFYEASDVADRMTYMGDTWVMPLNPNPEEED